MSWRFESHRFYCSPPFLSSPTFLLLMAESCFSSCIFFFFFKIQRFWDSRSEKKSPHGRATEVADSTGLECVLSDHDPTNTWVSKMRAVPVRHAAVRSGEEQAGRSANINDLVKFVSFVERLQFSGFLQPAKKGKLDCDPECMERSLDPPLLLSPPPPPSLYLSIFLNLSLSKFLSLSLYLSLDLSRSLFRSVSFSFSTPSIG